MARNTNGLCLITTRERVSDLDTFENSSLKRIDLENLNCDDGARLLDALGVQGTHKELCEAVEDFDGHALALNLLEKDQPDTLEEMEPLFAAVAHGCQAQLIQQTFDDIYWKRILRESSYYLVKQLGAFGSLISTLSNFLKNPWDNISNDLKDAAKAVALNQAGFALRAVGRLREATEPMQAGENMRLEQQNWKGAAIQAGNLSELWLTLGEVENAVATSRRSAEYADKSGDAFQRYARRTTLADALHHTGDRDAARLQFEQAESLKQQSQPAYKFLYSVSGYRYCDLLLGLGRAGEVLERAKEMRQVAIDNNSSLLTFALVDLAVGRAHAHLGERAAARTHLDRAVAGLRQSGQQQEMPRGLLARAAFFRTTQDFDKAETDLFEAQEIAERGEMNLYLADIHLEWCRLRLAQGDPDQARECFQQAATQVRDMGYGRREAEVEELRQTLE